MLFIVFATVFCADRFSDVCVDEQLSRNLFVLLEDSAYTGDETDTLDGLGCEYKMFCCIFHSATSVLSALLDPSDAPRKGGGDTCSDSD